jgi:hypothetical protein
VRTSVLAPKGPNVISPLADGEESRSEYFQGRAVVRATSSLVRLSERRAARGKAIFALVSAFSHESPSCALPAGARWKGEEVVGYTIPHAASVI